MIGYVLGFVPWWVWAVALAIALGVTYSIWLPIGLALPRRAKELIVVALLLIFAVLAGFYWGSESVRARWAAADAAATIRAAELDRIVAAKAEVVDKQETAVEADADKPNEVTRDAYVAELEKRVAAACRADDADVGRLRDVR